VDVAYIQSRKHNTGLKLVTDHCTNTPETIPNFPTLDYPVQFTLLHSLHHKHCTQHCVILSLSKQLINCVCRCIFYFGVLTYYYHTDDIDLHQKCNSQIALDKCWNTKLSSWYQLIFLLVTKLYLIWNIMIFTSKNCISDLWNWNFN